MKSGNNPKPAFNLKAFLTQANSREKTAVYHTNRRIFDQGDSADAIFYIQKGKVKLTVLSRQGKEAVIAILADNDFFGEGCLAGQATRMATATAISACSIMKLE